MWYSFLPFVTSAKLVMQSKRRASVTGAATASYRWLSLSAFDLGEHKEVCGVRDECPLIGFLTLIGIGLRHGIVVLDRNRQVRGVIDQTGNSWMSERRGLVAKCCFHRRGVSSATRLAGCSLIRCRTSTR